MLKQVINRLSYLSIRFIFGVIVLLLVICSTVVAALIHMSCALHDQLQKL